MRGKWCVLLSFGLVLAIVVYSYMKLIDCEPNNLGFANLLVVLSTGIFAKYPKFSRKFCENLITPEDTINHHFSKDVLSFIDNEYFVGEQFNIDLNIYEPKEGVSEKTSILIFFHGSGFTLCHPNFNHRMIQRFLRNDIAVVAPNYRKSPEFKRKSIFQDARETLNWVKQKYGENRKIILVGASAGGSMVIALSRYLRETNYELYPKDQIFSVTFYPWVCFLGVEDGKCPVTYEEILWEKGTLSGSILTTFMEMSRDDEIDESEIHNFFSSVSDLPNFLVFTAGRDVLGREGNYFGRMLVEENPNNELMEYKDEVHGYFLEKEKTWTESVEKMYEKFNTLYG